MKTHCLVLALALSVAFFGCRRRKGGAADENATAPRSPAVEAPADPALAAAESARVAAAVEAVKTGRSSPEQQQLLNQRLLEFEMRHGRPAGGMDELLKANGAGQAPNPRAARK